jgi:hypothetical protein
MALPEVWFPYGGVETLVTIQAENLGTMVEPIAGERNVDTERLAELLKGPTTLFICDASPTTLETVQELVRALGQTDSLRVVAVEPRRVEGPVPELKGKVVQLARGGAAEGEEPVPAPALAEAGRKVFIATARPDPLFGIVDARVEATSNWFSGGLREAATARKDLEPTPFERTLSFERAAEIAGTIEGATFLTAIPRGGRARSVVQDAPFDALANGFLESNLSPARGLIVGAGGRGYDDTFSSALRSVWSALAGVRRSGEILLVSECADGLGSPALEMLASGRISGESGRRREKYIPGIEEIYYLNKLKEEYGVLLLSGLPEIFAKNGMGLTTARGSGEAVGRLLNKLGRTAKVNVVTRAAECRVKSA